MIFQANKIDWQEADSVLEAIILEANLIKKYQPKYQYQGKIGQKFQFRLHYEACPQCFA